MSVKYSEEFKQSVIQRYENGEKLKNLGSELNIASSTLYHWRTEYCSVKTPGKIYTPKEIDSLSRRLNKLEHELKIISLSGIISEKPLRERLDILEQLYQTSENQYSVHELCEALQVDRGTFYNHIFRRVDPSKRNEEQHFLEAQIEQIFNDSEQRYGSQKIRFILQQKGIKISDKRIRTIMQNLGLQSIRSDAKAQYKALQKKEKKNILKQDFHAERPNQIWVSDITQFKIGNYYLYLCVILDLYSRKIVGYRISRSGSTHLVSKTFRDAFIQREKPNMLTFHSDRGSPYVSGTFMKLLADCGITQSFSKPATPYDNAVAETFFASFKKEEAYRRSYTSEQNFLKSVERYAIFYNQVRPHKALHYMTPQAFEEAYFAKNNKDLQFD